jgi:replicative superfamily II helicase
LCTYVQIIIYLDTGAGKTLVAALLAKHQIALRHNVEANKRVVCLVPTTILVAQQAAVFRKYVAQSIGEYTGDMGVDAWSPEKWREQIEYASPYFTARSQEIIEVLTCV